MTGMDYSHLSGKTILITGASKGIGRAVAQHLAPHGAELVLAARSGDQVQAIAAGISANGGQARGIACDVSDYSQVSALVSQLAVGTTGIDVLINNAGVIDPIARLADSDPTAWDAMIDINLKGVYHMMRAVLPGMLAQGQGTIINISSGAATSALEGWSHYCASKAGVLALTRCTHKEYGASGIRVLGLSPGTVATDMQKQIRASGINPVSKLLRGDHIPPEWVAQAIAYLCGPGGDRHLGTDFSLKSDAGRKEAGLSLI